LEQRRPLYAGVAKHNLASIRVLQKCGFTFSDSAAEKCNEEDDSHVLLVLTAPNVDFRTSPVTPG
jgi:RimJ/RimL family protein N-acetyltransferase